MKVKTFKRMSKRFISTLLSVVMVLSLFTVCAVGSTVTVGAWNSIGGYTITVQTNNWDNAYLFVGKDDYTSVYYMNSTGTAGEFSVTIPSGTSWNDGGNFFFSKTNYGLDNGAGKSEGASTVRTNLVNGSYTCSALVDRNSIELENGATYVVASNGTVTKGTGGGGSTTTSSSTGWLPVTLFNYRNETQIGAAGSYSSRNETILESLGIDTVNGDADGYNGDIYKTYNAAVSDWFSDEFSGDGTNITPLYQGNFYNWSAASMYHFMKLANCANQSGTSSVAQNLVDTELNADGNITQLGLEMPQFSKKFMETANTGADIQSIYEGLKFETKTEKKSNGNTWYSYDSATDGNRAIGIDNYTTNEVSGRDGSDSDTEYDERKGTNSSGGETGPGFFPFNRIGIDHKEVTNSFGARFDIKFLMTEDGRAGKGSETEREDLQFNFSGDDDLWVFIDGYLALDMGGSHNMATGSINLNTSKMTTDVTSGYYDGTYDSNNTFGINKTVSTGSKALDPRIVESLTNETATTREHTLTIFYMERGMFDSNLSFSFMLPQTNSLEIKQEINTTNVNPGLLTETLKTAENDVFSVNLQTNSASADSNTTAQIPIAEDFVRITDSGKETELQKTADGDKEGKPFTNEAGGTTIAAETTFTWTDFYASSTGIGTGAVDGEGNINLLYNQSARFNDQFVPGSTFFINQVDQIKSFDLSAGATKNQPGLTANANSSDRTVNGYYSPSLKIVDAHDDEITYDSSNNNEFKLESANGSQQGVRLTATYTNTVKTTDINITKSLADTETDADPNTAYPFTIQFKNVFGGTNIVWQSYPVNYTISSKTDTFTYNELSPIWLCAGETATITGVPVGTEYRIIEGTSTDTSKVYTVAQVKTDGSTDDAIEGNTLSGGNTYEAKVGTKPANGSITNLDFVNTSQAQQVVYRFKDRLVQTGMPTQLETCFTYFTGSVPGVIPDNITSDSEEAKNYIEPIKNYAPNIQNVLCNYDIEDNKIWLNHIITNDDLKDVPDYKKAGLKVGDKVHLAEYTATPRLYTVTYSSRNAIIADDGSFELDENDNMVHEERNNLTVSKYYNEVITLAEKVNSMKRYVTYNDDGEEVVHNFRYWAMRTKYGSWTPLSTDFTYAYRVSDNIEIKAVYDSDFNEELKQLPGPEVEDEEVYHVTGEGSGYDAVTLDTAYDSYTIQKNGAPENRTRVNIMFGSVGSADVDTSINYVGYVLIKNKGSYAMDDNFSESKIMEQLQDPTTALLSGKISDNNNTSYDVQVRSYAIQTYISNPNTDDSWADNFTAGNITLTNKNRMNFVFDIKNTESTQKPYYTCYTFMVRGGETYISDTPAYFSLREAPPTVQDPSQTKVYNLRSNVVVQDCPTGVVQSDAGHIELSGALVAENEGFFANITPTRFTTLDGVTYDSELVSLQVGKLTIPISELTAVSGDTKQYLDIFTAEKYLNSGEDTLTITATFKITEDKTNIVVTPNKDGTYVNGTVKVLNPETGEYVDSAIIPKANGEFSLKAEANSGYEFKGWDTDNDGTADDTTNNPIKVSVNKDTGAYTMPKAIFEEEVVPEGRTIYLKPNLDDWTKDSARFALWAHGSSSVASAWYDFTKVADGIYSVTIDESYTAVNFVRMNGSTTTNSWDNKWNQTQSVALEDGKNLYTITGGSGDNYTGSWSTY